MTDTSTYIELIKFLIYNKTQFISFVLIYSSIIMMFLFWRILFKSRLKRKNKIEPQGFNLIDKVEQQTVALNNKNGNRISKKESHGYKLFFLINYAAIFSSVLLIFISFFIYLNVGYIAFPDHNSFGEKIYKQDFSDKPSQ